MDRSDPSGAVRWLDTDAAGDDAAGAFAHAVHALASGDRSALGGSEGRPEPGLSAHPGA
jgi:hypothetical protein